ncbi:MAG TPA: hypothetical protein VM286_07765 [Candidatus Thermoplasmatota archaeon]|nr:hypothetical protein [Candidatus Thermoplasmatota archaeon]
MVLLLASGCLLPPARPADCTSVDLSATSSGTPGPGGWCPVPAGKTETAPPAAPTFTQTGSRDPNRYPSPDTCSATLRCTIPAADADPGVEFLLAPAYAHNTTATIRIRNVGEANYTFSWSQASCVLQVYSNATGHRVWLGVCSDYSTFEHIAPGAEADLFIWNLKECTVAGEWYGGCKGWTPVPRGAYELRQTFCHEDEPSSCTTAGATLRID